MQEKITGLKELLKAEINGRDDARKIQAAEYARRLAELNHAHQQRMERDAEFVLKGKFEDFQREFREYKTTTEAALQLAAGAKKGAAGTLNVIVLGFGFMLTMGLIFSTALSIYAFFRTQQNAEKIPVAATQPQAIYVIPNPSPTPPPILNPTNRP